MKVILQQSNDAGEIFSSITFPSTDVKKYSTYESIVEFCVRITDRILEYIQIELICQNRTTVMSATLTDTGDVIVRHHVEVNSAKAVLGFTAMARLLHHKLCTNNNIYINLDAVADIAHAYAPAGDN